MVQSRGLGHRLGGHGDASVAASCIGLGRYAQNATLKAQKFLKKSRQIYKKYRHQYLCITCPKYITDHAQHKENA